MCLLSTPTCIHIFLPHYPLGPSHLPLETATRHPLVLRQPRPLQMQPQPPVQEQGEFHLTSMYSRLVCHPCITFRAHHYYYATAKGRAWSDLTGSCTLYGNVGRPIRLQEQVFVVTKIFQFWTQRLKYAAVLACCLS